MDKTLVLDSRCLPIDCYTVRKTMLHLETNKFKKHIQVISEYKDRVVKTGGREIQLPAVIRLVPGEIDGRWTNRVVKRTKSVRFSRRNILARDNGDCQYCGRHVGTSGTLDHVLPRSQGGDTSWENIVTCCRECNQMKGGRTPMQAGMRLLSMPKRPTQNRGPFIFGFFEEGMPEEWRPFLPVMTERDVKASRIYWNGRLR